MQLSSLYAALLGVQVPDNSLASTEQPSVLPQTTSADPFESYHWSPDTVISFPGSPQFSNATQRWDIYKPPAYTVAITPATEEDVVTAVKAAQHQGLPLLATGGRHGYSTTLNKMQGGVAIDLSKLNSIKISKQAETLTIGPGVRFGDILDPVYEAGFQIQTGTATCAGMIGATLGGGIGRSNGLSGLIVDALVSARVVLANGTLLEITERQNPDLFWGVRGAGHNFGAITSATYQLEPLYREGIWTSVDLVISLDKNASYFETLGDMLPLPKELTVQTTVIYSPDLNSTQLMASLVYAGPEEEALEAISPILDNDLGPFLFQDIKTIPWNKVNRESTFQMNDPNCRREQIVDIFGFNVRQFHAPTFSTSLQKMAQFYEQNPSARGSAILIETWPTQAVERVPDEETAYPWRDAVTYGLILFGWEKEGDPVEGVANKLGRELRGYFARTGGYGKDGEGAVYVNYARGDENLESIYGERKLMRLAELKRRYDPDNVFGFTHGLPRSYS